MPRKRPMDSVPSSIFSARYSQHSDLDGCTCTRPVKRRWPGHGAICGVPFARAAGSPRHDDAGGHGQRLHRGRLQRRAAERTPPPCAMDSGRPRTMCRAASTSSRRAMRPRSTAHCGCDGGGRHAARPMNTAAKKRRGGCWILALALPQLDARPDQAAPSASSNSVSISICRLFCCSSGPSIRKVSSTRSPSVETLASCRLMWCRASTRATE